MDATLPPCLIDACRTHRLLVVAGAGISMLPPASLPSWWGFNNALFEGLRAHAADAVPEAADILAGITLERDVSVTAFSQLVVSSFAGNGYFPLLIQLEGAQPNANHIALAQLAAVGAVTDIVTTNFDTLVEQAFRAAGVPLEVLVQPHEYDRIELRLAGRCRLHKIHGSVTDAASLIDTVSQKLRGLPSARRALLTALFRNRHVLFIGFSGADFDMNADYLPLRANREGGVGFTWIYRDTPPPVAATLAHEKGVFLQASLPDILGRLGADLPAVPNGRSQPADLRPKIDAWTHDVTVGPWACAALCQRLLYELGDEAAAARLNGLLEKAVSDALISGNFTPGMGAVARQLATAALTQRDFHRSAAWSAQELEFHNALERFLTDGAKRLMQPDARREYLMNTAGVFNNLGLAYALQRDAGDRAEQMFREASARAREAQDHELAAVIQFNIGHYVTKDADGQLRALRLAQGMAREAGAGVTQAEAYLAEAHVLVGLNELDLALDRAAKATPLLSVIGRPGLIWDQAVLRARVAARRNKVPEAIAACGALLARLPPASALGARVASVLRAELGFDASGRLQLRDLLAGLGDRDEEWPEHPVFLPSLPLVENEEGYRDALAMAEFAGQHDQVAGLFGRLCGLLHQKGAADRLVDNAFGMRAAAAERAGVLRPRIVAEHYLGIGHDLLGNLDEACTAFRAAIALAAQTQVSAGYLRANLGGVLWQLGEVAEAERQFAAGREEAAKDADWDNYLIASVNHGRHLVRASRREEALTVIREAAARHRLPKNHVLACNLESLEAFWAAGGTEAPGLDGNPMHPASPEPETTFLEQLAAETGAAPVLANLALRELDEGRFDEALRHIEEARRIYERDGDRIGLSKCANNLASVHAARQDWPAAIEATKTALRFADSVPVYQEGRILTLSNLAALYLQAGNPAEAAEAARACILQAPDGIRSWPYAYACVITAFAAAQLQQFGELTVAIPRAQRALRVVEDPARADFEQRLREMADNLATLAKAALEPPPREVSAAGMGWLRRAAAARSPAAKREILRKGCADPSLSAVDRATLHGEFGNVLMQARVLGEAELAYGVAARLYDDAGHPGMAWYARGVAAVGIHQCGDTKRGEEEILGVLRACPVPKVLANTLTYYANVVLAEHGDDPAALDRLRLQIIDTAALPAIDAETLGRLVLQLAQCEWHREDEAAAKVALQRAKELLVRSNSPFLETVKTLETAYAKGTGLIGSG